MKQINDISILEEDGWFIARDSDTGVTSQGATIDESKANLQEALSLYLKEIIKEAEADYKADKNITTLEDGDDIDNFFKNLQ